MLGLLVMFIGFIYLLISIGVIYFAARKAKQRGIARWKWGLPAGLVMYLLVFWDHIPTLVAHNYYCGKEAGFTVYKTLEKWKEENPDIIETFVSYRRKKTRIDGNETIYDLNQRFIWSLIQDKIFLSLNRNDNRVVDKVTGEILAQYIDFSIGYGNFVVSAKDLRAYKFWLDIWSCEKDGNKVNRKQFYTFEAEIEKLGEDDR